MSGRLAPPSIAAVAAISMLLLGACADSTSPESADRPSVVVTTAVLGDVVSEILGGDTDVRVLMPAGASPHEFQPSARDVAAVRAADAIVANGGGLEEGLQQVVESAEASGVPTFEAATRSGLAGDAASERGEHEDATHAEEAHGQVEDEHRQTEAAEGAHAEDAHDHDAGAAAHFFTSPAAMVAVVEAMADFFEAELPSLDVASLRSRAEAYVAELRAVDDEVAEIVKDIPAERKVLITNHDVLSAFASRYGFEIRGSVLPGSSTADSGDARTVARLAELIRELGVPAIFVDVSSSDALAQSLAREAGGIEVVELHTETLGGPESDASTYLDMVRTNARRIADALA